MADRVHKVLYYRVKAPSNTSPLPVGSPKPAEELRMYGWHPDHFIKVDSYESNETNSFSHGNGAITIIRLENNGNLKEVNPSFIKHSRTYLGAEDYESSDGTYFHYLASIINGNAKKISEKVFKAERARRI